MILSQYLVTLFLVILLPQPIHGDSPLPLIYTIDKAARIVTIQYNRDPKFVEFERTMEAVFKDSDYTDGFSFLLDRHLVDEPPSTEYIKSVVDFLRRHEVKLGKTCLAVAVRNTASYGMERMAQILAEDMEVHIQVFNDVEKAKEWLGSR